MRSRTAESILQAAGLRCTEGRVAMLEVLLRADNPLTHQEVLRAVEPVGLNRVSVYRALDAFLKAGIVHRVEVGDRVWRFAVCDCGNVGGHCHPHFTCRSCGKVECLNSVTLSPVLEPEKGYIIEEQEVYWRGLCPECSKG